MSDRALRVLEHVHGHLGWLAAVALVHPVVVLRTPARRALLATTLATALVTLTGALGVLLYPDYRARLKQAIFIDAPAIGWHFERKEHLAAGAIALSWAGLAAHLASRRQPDAAVRAALWRTSRAAYGASAALAILTGVLGVIVATYRTF